MRQNKKISVVIPAYNEEEAIGKAIDDIKTTMDTTPYEYEIIVVDDNSTDKTAEIVMKKDVKLIQHIENKGVGYARKTGILNANGNFIVMIDGDGTYPANSIPELLSFLPKYDMVIGARKTEAGTSPLFRKPAKWILKKFAEYITRKKIDDLNSGLRAFKKEKSLKFFSILPDGHSWVSTITIAFLSSGYDIKYVPIDYFKRKGKSTFHPIKDTANYFLLIFRTIMYFKPLKIFFPVGSLIFILGSIRTIYDAKVLRHIKESDIIIIMLSIFILTMGILADLIVKHSSHSR